MGGFQRHRKKVAQRIVPDQIADIGWVSQCVDMAANDALQADGLSVILQLPAKA